MSSQDTEDLGGLLFYPVLRSNLASKDCVRWVVVCCVGCSTKIVPNFQGDAPLLLYMYTCSADFEQAFAWSDTVRERCICVLNVNSTSAVCIGNRCELFSAYFELSNGLRRRPFIADT